MTDRPFGGRESLVAMLTPEYRLMAETCVKIGLAHPSWTVPEFFARRSKHHPRAVHGVANSLGHVVLEIRLQVGRDATLADAHQCMIHELAHAIVGPTEDHGPRFRETLRRMVRAHWPEIGPWVEVAREGDWGTYEEDENMIDALERLYLKRLGIIGKSITQIVVDEHAATTEQQA